MNITQLEIKEDEIGAHLLNPDHPIGGSKAKFFLGRGFSPSSPMVLANALARHAFAAWPGSTLATRFGVKHRIVGSLACPNGTTPDVLAVWMVQSDSTSASFVTAYPC